MLTTSTEVLNSLSNDFFREFARCEYCLKVVGFRSQGRDAKADWTAFAASVADLLEKPTSKELVEAIEYLLAKPPKKQVVVDGRLDWDPVLPEANSKGELVLLLICRVRNNLFHGGKFNGHWFEPERSAELLSASLTIIRNCIQASPKMQEAYRGTSS